MRRRPSRWWYALLALPLLGLLYPPLYARHDPELAGIPFFYWYQLMWVPIVAILSAAAYLLSRLTQRGNAAAGPRPPEKGPGEVS